MIPARELKLIVNVDPIDGFHMADYDFEVILYIFKNKPVVFKKNEGLIKKVDEDHYKVICTSELSKQLGKGVVKMCVICYVPDSDFPDGVRTEVIEDICTGETL